MSRCLTTVNQLWCDLSPADLCLYVELRFYVAVWLTLPCSSVEVNSTCIKAVRTTTKKFSHKIGLRNTSSLRVSNAYPLCKLQYFCIVGLMSAVKYFGAYGCNNVWSKNILYPFLFVKVKVGRRQMWKKSNMKFLIRIIWSSSVWSWIFRMHACCEVERSSCVDYGQFEKLGKRIEVRNLKKEEKMYLK